MMELNQFHHYACLLKVRIVLVTKGLSYKDIEITPVFNQVGDRYRYLQERFQYLIDGAKVLHDSSQIFRYQETKASSQQWIPKKPQETLPIHLIEKWANKSLAKLLLLRWLAEIHH